MFRLDLLASQQLNYDTVGAVGFRLRVEEGSSLACCLNKRLILVKPQPPAYSLDPKPSIFLSIAEDCR